MENFTRIDQNTRTFLTAQVAALKADLIQHPEVANGWTGRGQGCSALVSVDYQCPKPQKNVEGTITISINRGGVMRDGASCTTGVRRLNAILLEELANHELDFVFELGRRETDDDFHTWTATFNMDLYAEYIESIEAA